MQSGRPRLRAASTRSSICTIGGKQQQIFLMPVSSTSHGAYTQRKLLSTDENNEESDSDSDSGGNKNKAKSQAMTLRRVVESNYDRYGFDVADDTSSSQVFHKSKKIESKIMMERRQKEISRYQKWESMLSFLASNGTISITSNSPILAKLKERIRKGVPNDLRNRAWYLISDARKFAEKYPNPRQLDISTDSDGVMISASTPDEINRDIDRTFPKHKLFLDKDNGKGIVALRNVLRWYSIIDPEVGYCQGMNFLAGLFIITMDEISAFHTFCSAMQSSNEVPLRHLYLPDMIETQRVLYVYGELGKLHLGHLWQHLLDENMHPTMYATEWLMTMFCRGFSFDIVTRVMDVFLTEGYKIVYRVSLALIKNIEKELMDADFEGIMQIMRKIPELTDADSVMDLAWKIPVRRRDIDRINAEYDAIHSSNSDIGDMSSKAEKMAKDIESPTASKKKGWFS
jgi:TBC1 domain family member 10